jgi:hypothetical protein
MMVDRDVVVLFTIDRLTESPPSTTPPLVGSTTLYTPLTLRLYNWQLPEAAVFRPMLTHTSLAGLSS